LQLFAAAIGGSGINLTNQAEVSGTYCRRLRNPEGVILGQGVVDSVPLALWRANALLD